MMEKSNKPAYKLSLSKEIIMVGITASFLISSLIYVFWSREDSFNKVKRSRDHIFSYNGHKTVQFTNYECTKVLTHNILYFKGNGGSSLKVFPAYKLFPWDQNACRQLDSMIIPRTFSQIEEYDFFKEGPFVRIHESYIINLNYVRSYPRKRKERDKEIPLIKNIGFREALPLARGKRDCEYMSFYLQSLEAANENMDFKYEEFRKNAFQKCFNH